MAHFSARSRALKGQQMIRALAFAFQKMIEREEKEALLRKFLRFLDDLAKEHQAGVGLGTENWALR